MSNDHVISPEYWDRLLAEVQNERLLEQMSELRKLKHPRPTRLNYAEIRQCGLGKFIAKPQFTFIPVGRGLWTVINSLDAANICQHNWSVRKCSSQNTWYVQRFCHRKIIHLHRELTRCPDGLEPDHIDSNPLNNTRQNLRIGTHGLNIVSSRRRKPASGYFGVYWHPAAHKWQAYVHEDGKSRYVGLFDSAEKAARARDKEAIRLYRSFARLNFPSEVAA